ELAGPRAAPSPMRDTLTSPESSIRRGRRGAATGRSGTASPEARCAARQGRAEGYGGEPGDAMGGPGGRRRAAGGAELGGARSPPPAVLLLFQLKLVVRLAT